MGRDHHQKWERGPMAYRFDVQPDVAYEVNIAALADAA